MAGIVLIDTDKVWLLSKFNISTDGCDRKDGLCQYTILEDPDKILMIPDLHLAEEKFRSLAAPAGLRFYAGVPITIFGVKIGTLCVTDIQPRTFSSKQCEILIGMAQAVSVILQERFVPQYHEELINSKFLLGVLSGLQITLNQTRESFQELQQYSQSAPLPKYQLMIDFKRKVSDLQQGIESILQLCLQSLYYSQRMNNNNNQCSSSSCGFQFDVTKNKNISVEELIHRVEDCRRKNYFHHHGKEQQQTPSSMKRIQFEENKELLKHKMLRLPFDIEGFLMVILDAICCHGKNYFSSYEIRFSLLPATRTESQSNLLKTSTDCCDSQEQQQPLTTATAAAERQVFQNYLQFEILFHSFSSSRKEKRKKDEYAISLFDEIIHKILDPITGKLKRVATSDEDCCFSVDFDQEKVVLSLPCWESTSSSAPASPLPTCSLPFTFLSPSSPSTAASAAAAPPLKQFSTDPYDILAMKSNCKESSKQLTASSSSRGSFTGTVEEQEILCCALQLRKSKPHNNDHKNHNNSNSDKNQNTQLLFSSIQSTFRFFSTLSLQIPSLSSSHSSSHSTKIHCEQ
jgi:hypothetical protein